MSLFEEAAGCEHHSGGVLLPTTAHASWSAGAEGEGGVNERRLRVERFSFTIMVGDLTWIGSQLKRFRSSFWE